MEQKTLPVYPAIFRWDKDYQGYEVIFPDIPFRTCGKTLELAFLMACDLLRLVLEEHVVPMPEWTVPDPTPFFEVEAEETDLVLLVRPAIYEG